MSYSSHFSTHQAVILDHGPDSYDWVRARLATGEDCFLYPDSARTVPVKQLDIGTIVEVQQPRNCTNPGPTKWATTALALKMQDIALQRIMAPIEPKHDKTTAIKKISLSCRYSVSRHKHVEKIIDEHGFEGRYAVCDAVARCIDLCIENNLL